MIWRPIMETAPGPSLVYDTYRPADGMTTLALYPGGWLAAVMVRKLASALDLAFKVTDCSEARIVAEFVLPCPDTCAGVLLDEPVANFSSAELWILHIPDHAPPLEVISVNRLPAS